MLGRLHHLMRQEVFAGGQDNQGSAFLAGAEVELLHDPIFPVDPFFRWPACTGPCHQPTGPSKGPLKCRTFTAHPVLSAVPIPNGRREGGVRPRAGIVKSRIVVPFPLVSRWRNGKRTDDLAQTLVDHGTSFCVEPQRLFPRSLAMLKESPPRL